MTTTRLAALAVAAAVTALPAAACSSSHTSTPTSPPSSVQASPPTTTPSHGGAAQVRGLIASVAGNAAQVTQQNGTATVDFTGSTKVTEVAPGALTDVTAGGCVSVRTKHDEQSGQPITAASVRVSPAVDGKCPAGKDSGKHPSVRGTVASVAGTTVTLDENGAQQTVTVTGETKYTKESSANSQAIVQGKCITAHGSQNGGALQATSISLRPAANGKCPDGGHPHGH